MDSSKSAVQSGAATLNVLSWGTAGPDLVLLHPGVGDSRIWSSCAPRWSAHGYRVTGYDRRGFGLTRSSPEPHDDIADLLAVVDARKIDSAVVVGNSSGGGLAIDVALAYPERVRALVLVAPSPSGYDPDRWTSTAMEAEQDLLISAADESGDLALVNRLETRYWLDGVTQPEGRVSGEPRDLFIDMNDLALRARPIGEALSHPPAWPLLAQIEVPVLVVVGEFDLPGVQNQGRELADVLPSAEFVEIPGSAHCPQLDQAEHFANTVLEFLDQFVDWRAT